MKIRGKVKKLEVNWKYVTQRDETYAENFPTWNPGISIRINVRFWDRMCQKDFLYYFKQILYNTCLKFSWIAVAVLSLVAFKTPVNFKCIISYHRNGVRQLQDKTHHLPKNLTRSCQYTSLDTWLIVFETLFSNTNDLDVCEPRCVQMNWI